MHEADGDNTAVTERDTAAVAGDSAVAEDSQDKCDIDPMDALDELDVRPKAKPPKRKASNRAAVQAVVMPMRPKCAGRDSDATKTIYLYRQPAGMSKTKNTLCLRADCLDWLLSYAADQHHCQGVEALTLRSVLL